MDSTDPVMRGYFGKLPSRGDFLRTGLPRSFTDRWDAWLQTCLPDSRARLGEDWTLCWLEAPVWRFALAPGLCGPHAVLGVWVPSVDRAGRDFPLMLAVVGPDFAAVRPLGAAWLDVAEAAACNAVTAAQEPETLLRSMAAPPAVTTPEAELPDPGTGSVWWTQGAPLVAPMRLTTDTMPGPAIFSSMLYSIEETA